MKTLMEGRPSSRVVNVEELGGWPPAPLPILYPVSSTNGLFLSCLPQQAMGPPVVCGPREQITGLRAGRGILRMVPKLNRTVGNFTRGGLVGLSL